MKVTKITYGRTEQKSMGYQNAGANMSIEVTLDEGESAEAAYQRAKAFVSSRVSADASEAAIAAKVWREEMDEAEAAAIRAKSAALIAAHQAKQGGAK